MNGLVWAFLLSLTPVIELRGGIPVAVAAGYPLWVAFIVCVLANILVTPLVFLFLEFIHHRLMHTSHYRSAFDKALERSQKKVKPYVDKYGVIGLLIFVAVPIPGTGAYTAALVAWMLGMSKWRAFTAISIGVLASGVIVLSLAGGIRVLA